MPSLRFLLGASALLAPAVFAGPVTTVPWNGHAGAATFTYDDARASQIPTVVPQLDSLGLKATFFIAVHNVGTFNARRPEWLQVARKGHELANHTYRHENVHQISADSVTKIVRSMADTLRGLDTAIQSVTFAYPNCNVPQAAALAGVNAENFIARGCNNTSYAWATAPSEWMNVQGLIMQPSNQNTGINLLNTAKNQGRWAIFVIHDVADPTPDIYSITPPNNRQLLTTAVANGLWVDTYQNIGAYYRAHFVLDTVKAQRSIAASPAEGWLLEWKAPHAKLPRAVPVRVRLDSTVFGAAFNVRQDDKVVAAQADGSFIIDFMKLRLEVRPGTSALATSRPLPRAIRAAALRAALRPSDATDGAARRLDGKASVGPAAAGVRVETTSPRSR